jgi:small GTP-binding protein
MSARLSGIRELKLVLVGNTSVGKTCIVKRAITGSFDTQTAATLGGSFVTKILVVESLEFRMHIWDTAGQERYRTLTPMYFRGADVALVTYAIDDQESFNSVESWLELLRNNAPTNIIVVLVGNKSDKEDDRVVSTVSGQETAVAISAHFWEVSAKTGYSIDELFEGIAGLFLDQKKPEILPRTIQTLDIASDRENSGCC